jgi:hypothetical protein
MPILFPGAMPRFRRRFCTTRRPKVCVLLFDASLAHRLDFGFTLSDCRSGKSQQSHSTGFSLATPSAIHRCVRFDRGTRLGKRKSYLRRSRGVYAGCLVRAESRRDLNLRAREPRAQYSGVAVFNRSDRTASEGISVVSADGWDIEDCDFVAGNWAIGIDCEPNTAADRISHFRIANNRFDHRV